MNSRELVRRALAHQPGPVPIDFGSTTVTGIHVSVVAALRDHFGLRTEPVKVTEPYQMLGEIAGDLREAMGIDSMSAPPRPTIFGFPLEGPWREWRTPWGQVVLVPAGFQTRTDPNGDVFIFPAGDRAAPASGHMPASGYFFDAIIRQEPFEEDALDPADNLEEFAEFSAEDVAYWEVQASALRDRACAVVGNMGGTAPGASQSRFTIR